MNLPDTNVLIYSVNLDSPQHTIACNWLSSGFDSVGGVCFSWVALLGFIRISTRSGILPKPLSAEAALSVVDQWLNHPAAKVINPGDRHASLLGRLIVGAGTAGDLTNDEHLAALAMEHDATLGSFDRDFQRFSGLKLELLKG